MTQQDAAKLEPTEAQKKFMEQETETKEESMIRVLLRIRRMTDGEKNEPARRILSYQWYGGQIISVGSDD